MFRCILFPDARAGDFADYPPPGGGVSRVWGSPAECRAFVAPEYSAGRSAGMGKMRKSGCFPGISRTVSAVRALSLSAALIQLQSPRVRALSELCRGGSVNGEVVQNAPARQAVSCKAVRSPTCRPGKAFPRITATHQNLNHAQRINYRSVISFEITREAYS